METEEQKDNYLRKNVGKQFEAVELVARFDTGKNKEPNDIQAKKDKKVAFTVLIKSTLLL